jgi:hypothetical protein
MGCHDKAFLSLRPFVALLGQILLVFHWVEAMFLVLLLISHYLPSQGQGSWPSQVAFVLLGSGLLPPPSRIGLREPSRIPNPPITLS